MIKKYGQLIQQQQKYTYGTNKDIIHKKEEIICMIIINQYKN